MIKKLHKLQLLLRYWLFWSRFM